MCSAPSCTVGAQRSWNLGLSDPRVPAFSTRQPTSLLLPQHSHHTRGPRGQRPARGSNLHDPPLGSYICFAAYDLLHQSAKTIATETGVQISPRHQDGQWERGGGFVPLAPIVWGSPSCLTGHFRANQSPHAHKQHPFATCNDPGLTLDRPQGPE